MPIVVFKVIPLVLEGVEGLMLNLPARPTAPHNLKPIDFRHPQIGDPGEMLAVVKNANNSLR